MVLSQNQKTTTTSNETMHYRSYCISTKGDSPSEQSIVYSPRDEHKQIYSSIVEHMETGTIHVEKSKRMIEVLIALNKLSLPDDMIYLIKNYLFVDIKQLYMQMTMSTFVIPQLQTMRYHTYQDYPEDLPTIWHMCIDDNQKPRDYQLQFCICSRCGQYWGWGWAGVYPTRCVCDHEDDNDDDDDDDESGDEDEHEDENEDENEQEHES